MDALGRREIFLFEGFHLDRRGLFRRDERGILTPVAIGGRALDLLRVLVEHREEVLSKTEIMAAVWPQMVVEDSNLAFQIAAPSTGDERRQVAFRRWRDAAIVLPLPSSGSRQRHWTALPRSPMRVRARCRVYRSLCSGS